MMTGRYIKGQSLVELLLAMGLATLLLPALFSGLVISRQGKAQEAQRLQATALVKEAQEATRSVWERSWTSFAANGTYHPQVSGSAWTLVSGAQTVGDYTRKIDITDVFRNVSGAIVPTGGIVDTSTKRVEITVSWPNPLPSSIVTTNYFQRHLGNAALQHTTQADFSGGDKVTTESANIAGGELRLESWSSPGAPTQVNIAGNTQINAVVVSGSHAFVGTPRRSGPEFVVVDLVTLTQVGGLELNEQVAAMTISGSFIYAVSANNSAQLRVIDVTTPTAPQLRSTFNTGAARNGTSIAYAANFVYIGALLNSNREFYVVNVSNPSGPTLGGSREINLSVNEVNVSGSYAYLATNNSGGQLRILDVSNPASIPSPIVYNVGVSRNALSIFYLANTVFLGIVAGTGSEFYTINVSNPTSPSPLGSLDVGGDVNSLFVVNGIAYLATPLAGGQFRTIGVGNPASPTAYGSQNLGGVANSVYFDKTSAYLGTANASAELQRVLGGGGNGFNNAGSAQSATIDAGSAVAFNYVVLDTDIPPSTTLQFQLAINSDNSTWSYFGPDGTASSYFTASGAIPLNLINGRYLRYKATFAGANTLTPLVNQVSVNYSP